MADGPSGFIQVSNYVFQFNDWGQLNYIVKSRGINADAHIREFQNKLAKEFSPIDADGAYQLATQWLARASIDIDALEKQYRHEVSYPTLSRAVRSTSKTGKPVKTTVVPDFWVTWGRDDPKLAGKAVYALQIEILGPTRALERLTINDHSLSKRPRIRLDGTLVLQDLPNQAFMELWQKPELNVTNVFGLLRTSTAYQQEMLRRMLEEANWVRRQLGESHKGTLKLEDVTESFVVPPRFGYRGYIARDNFGVQFDELGKLKYIFVALDGAGAFESQLDAYYELMASKPMLVDSNSVVQLAGRWLGDLQIDVAKMHPAAVPAARRYEYAKGKPSHLWWVRWELPQQSDNAFIVVVVDGTIPGPNKIVLNDRSCLLRSGISIPNAEELMKIPDPAPQRYRLKPHLNVLAAHRVENTH
jgi:hypothetical protein